MLTREQCLKNNVDLYRRYMRRAPWNSKTRKGWRALIDQAERELKQYPAKSTNTLDTINTLL